MKQKEIRKQGHEVVTFHLSSFGAWRSGMVRPLTSLPCGEKNVLALPFISSESNRRSVSPPVSQSVRRPACYRPATYYLTQ